MNSLSRRDWLLGAAATAGGASGGCVALTAGALVMLHCTCYATCPIIWSIVHQSRPDGGA